MECTRSILRSSGRLEDSEEEEEEWRDALSLCPWPENREGNCILLVEGSRVRVNKMYLSMHSHFFDRMFYGDFSAPADNRYEVKKVGKVAFIQMLRVILPIRKPIDGNNVEALLVIADRFFMDNLRRECIAFLCSDTEAANSVTCVDLILLAFRCGIEELKDCVSARLSRRENNANLRKLARFDEIKDDNVALRWLCDTLITTPRRMTGSL